MDLFLGNMDYREDDEVGRDGGEGRREGGEGEHTLNEKQQMHTTILAWYPYSYLLFSFLYFK